MGAKVRAGKRAPRVERSELWTGPPLPQWGVLLVWREALGRRVLKGRPGYEEAGTE